MKFLKYIAILSLLLTQACGGCSDEKKAGEDGCEPNETLNPISGICIPDGRPGRDTGGNDDMAEDAFINPFLDMAADVPEEFRCSSGIDSDLDGLDNDCECVLTTDPARPDTDGDGALDGQEDANQNCVWDLGQETNPREVDTDGDGLEDGGELDEGTDGLNPDTDGDNISDGVEAASCLNPLEQDTDADGLPDDVEDLDLDGMLGTCPNRVYAVACANGESDPCNEDTDGDGTKDSSEAQFLACRAEDTANLSTPQLVVNATGNYQLVLETGVNSGAVSSLNAHAFDDATNRYAGFVVRLTEPNGVGSPSEVANTVFNQVRGQYAGASQRASGRRIRTHDLYDSTAGAIVQLPNGLRPDDARDLILARVAGVGSVSHSVNGNFSPAGGASVFVYQVIRRPNGQYVLVGAVASDADYNNNNGLTGIRVDDITGGVAVAEADEMFEDECVSYRVTVNPKVDFLWVLDRSGSMDDEIAQVRAFASQFAGLLNASNLDWRIGVTSGTCIDIANDNGVSQSVRDLYGPGGFGGSCPSIPIGSANIKNGILCNNRFTTDANEFTSCIDQVNQFIDGEHTVTIAAAAIDRATPREDNNPAKIRTDAALIVVSVTDEFDDHFQSVLGFTDAGGQGDPQEDPTTRGGYSQAAVDQAVQPFVDYFLSPDVAATVFGIYWVPGTQCSTASEAAAGIDSVVAQTGGAAGSICQGDLTATLQQIATASAGIASGLRLRGVPLAPTIEVKNGQAATGNIVDLNRSRADGFDYDATVNRVSFSGPNPPQTNDRVVIPYRRWAGSLQQCVTDADCPQSQKLRCIDSICI